MNRIIRIDQEVNKATGYWTITVTKEFSEEYGGGTQEFVFTASSAQQAHNLVTSIIGMHRGEMRGEINLEVKEIGESK